MKKSWRPCSGASKSKNQGQLASLSIWRTYARGWLRQQHPHLLQPPLTLPWRNLFMLRILWSHNWWSQYATSSLRPVHRQFRLLLLHPFHRPVHQQRLPVLRLPHLLRRRLSATLSTVLMCR
jgi:hypothetical protein